VQAQRAGKLQRNFQGYSTHGDCDLLSFGASAISAFGNVYIQNAKRVEHYQKSIDSGAIPFIKGIELTSEDLLRQFVINQLICHFNLNFAAVDSAFCLAARTHFAKELSQLKPMIDDGLLTINDDGIEVLNAGRLLIRRICMVFDEYLNNASTIRYSKVI
jgi:oxygen-independent coproporphyrinogen-3 oxidase